MQKRHQILAALGYSTKQMIAEINSQNTGENAEVSKVLGFLHAMQLIEFKEVLDETERTLVLQNHKMQLLNGAMKGQVVNVEPQFFQPNLSLQVRKPVVDAKLKE